MTAILVFVILALTLATGTPIAIAMAATVMISLALFAHVPLLVVVQQMFGAADSFALMAIPLFVLSGNIMTAGGLSKKLIRIATDVFGPLPGGLAIATTAACAFFAAISGSSPATVAAIGAIMVPALTKANYDEKFSVGVVTASGSLGILIPPSIPMVVYCLATGSPVGKLFLAGVVPGLLLAGVFAAQCLYAGTRKDFQRTPRPSFRELMTSLREGIWGLVMPLIVLGGIYSGVFTPTEAAAVAVIYSAFVGSFIYKDIKACDYVRILRDSAAVSAMIMFIICAAAAFSWFLTSQGIPQSVASWMSAAMPQPWMFLLAVNIMLLIVGCFMEPNSAILVLAPLFLPVVQRMGIDPIHFGIVMIVNLELGMLTPPLGLNLFVSAGMTGIPLERVVRSTLPFMLSMLAFLLVITYVPAVSTFLPEFLGNLK
jgi:C4-dicarboxylate transporter DctM subunit